jgi:thiosulfate/3-mercaptopyruvate sulfurtransferase
MARAAGSATVGGGGDRDRERAGITDIELAELTVRLGEVPVIDVRRPEEYDGTFGAPCDPRQGHIPGAVNIDVQELMLMREGELRERVGVAEGGELVCYCHSGSRSAFAVEALRRFGYDARNYPGSWHEWSRTELPLET